MPKEKSSSSSITVEVRAAVVYAPLPTFPTVRERGELEADVLLRMDRFDEARELSSRVFPARQAQGARHEEIAESAQQLMRIEQARGRQPDVTNASHI